MRRHLPDLATAALLFVLPLLLFWPQTLGGRTLLPAENLYQFEPYASYRAQAGAPEIPHNALLSDLILQNFQWKTFIRASFAAGEMPLWNPHQFSGIPFFAAGQQSTLYPLSLIYYVLPLPAAYGWFTVVQLWLAGLFMMALVRGIGLRRTAGAGAGIIYQLSAFFVTSAVFPMIIAAAAWLPLLLLMVENIIVSRPLLKRPARAPWAALGAAGLGISILAGHVEITYYTLIILAYYAGARLLVTLWRGRADRRSALRAAAEQTAWLGAMVALGLGLGAVQFVPLFEAASGNFRSGSASFEQVLGWAHPPRDLIQFILPNFYGSPAQHSYYDVFGGGYVSLIDQVITSAAGARLLHTEWGIKNYVEGALYVGILPLALATLGLLRRRMGLAMGAPYGAIFAILGLFALTFMFGLPTYAILFYTLPGIDQLHSPFRWVFALTLSVAVLAGLGIDALLTGGEAVRRWARRFGLALALAGGLALGGLLISRLLFTQVEPLIDWLLARMVTASGEPAALRFSDARMFYSVQFANVLIFGVVALASGVLLILFSAPPGERARAARRSLWLRAGLLSLIAADLMIASWSFNPASDPAWLEYTPPAIDWLRDQPGDWRYITLDDPTQPPLFQANMTLRYGLDDVRGYESIIPAQYVDFMRGLAPQVQLDFNRIAPLYTVYPPGVPFDAREALISPQLNLLNVRYVITHTTTSLADVPGYALVYEDAAVRIWENSAYFPRASLISQNEAAADADLLDALAAAAPVIIDRTSSRELRMAVTITEPARLFVLETHQPGWRAFARPLADAEADETPLVVQPVLGNFMAVDLPEAGAWSVRLIYSPQSFQIGAFLSFISGLLVLLLAGGWLWRTLLIPPGEGDPAASVSRVARNSIAPIVLNLFNRGIDFAFSIVMLRILGPADAGAYFYAGVIFVWFEIFTNFGLNLYLTREVARDRSRARQLFVNTSAMRLGLALIGVPLMLGFLGLRQSVVSPPLTPETVIAIGLLYIGLVPTSLSTGLTALFYAFERAETPAAITTVSTLCKAVFGLGALLLGWGIIGLAAVSILTNLITLAILSWYGRPLLRGAREGQRAALDRTLIRRMGGHSWPLMLNHFLATIFFQIDVVIIEAFHSARMVGQYSVAYKWVAALNIIPAFFTQALLPVMSRQAQEDRAALKRTYALAIKLLVSVALPVAVVFTFMAEPLVGLLGGAQFLPEGAIATQLMIWSIPIGWMNSLTQYVLIALDLQRRITMAFIIGVSFNIVTNLIFVPQFGFQAAAITTIASEAALLVPFALLLHKALGRINWLGLVWRPVCATAAMIGAILLLWPAQPLLALSAGGAVYLGLWVGLRALTHEEWLRLFPLLPGPLQRMTERFSIP
jgi:O-antigen/teichoic acid export membrane protein